MSETTRDPGAASPEPADSRPAVFGYGPGGVPWYLLLLYIGFLVFFAWYVLDFQVTSYFENPTGNAPQELPTDG